MANVNTTGLSPPQLVLPPHFTILESFGQPLPHYIYHGKAESSSLGTTTAATRPPRYALERPATVTPAAGGQPVANLWQDIGSSMVQQMKNNIDTNWIHLQPVWQQTQQVYDQNYGNVYAAAASSSQPPASFRQSFSDPRLAIHGWNSMNQAQRNMVAEREGEKAGRDAVSAWIRQEEGKMSSNLQSVLTSHARPWLEWMGSYPAEREHLYMQERATQHRNEADVVRSAAMYLVHPVMAVLDADPITSGAIVLHAEDASVVNNNITSTVRTDITFYRYNPVGDDRPICVMEFKRRGVIRPDQFETAFAAGAPANGGTLFNHEALKLIQQAATYAITFQTRHVALFDWSFMVLCYFGDMQYNNPSTVGNRVEIQVLPVGNPSTPNGLGFNNSARSHLFRPALLGFLKSAYAETP